MLPVSLYTPVYHHAMLVVVIGFALLYLATQAPAAGLATFNQVAVIVIGFGVALFMGFRPISGIYFVDMGAYASEYERVRQGYEGRAADVLFNGLMRLCAPFLPATGFFFVCALIYIAPLAVASWRVHGVWAFPVFLAFLTAFSFWGYGTNGIRNGMAASVVILAFAFQDLPVIMLPLMAAAAAFHASTLLPAGAFLLVRYVKRTEIWLAFWVLCAAASSIGGNVGGMLVAHYNPFASDERLEKYIYGANEGGRFRADFLAYSIVPVVVALLLAGRTRARARRPGARVRGGRGLNWMWHRRALRAIGVGSGKLACAQGGRWDWGVASARLGGAGRGPSSGLAAAWESPGGRGLAAPQAKATPGASDRLPGVRLLRTDPFYARLVNTYLLANALWILVIHADQSNRFAYLSWFMMPWVLLYPFVPGKVIHRPRTGLIAAILCGQYLFTYVMGVVINPLRGIL